MDPEIRSSLMCDSRFAFLLPYIDLNTKAIERLVGC